VVKTCWALSIVRNKEQDLLQFWNNLERRAGKAKRGCAFKPRASCCLWWTSSPPRCISSPLLNSREASSSDAYISHHPSIHSHLLSPRSGRGQQTQQADQDFPLTRHFPAHSGKSRGVPRPAASYNPSSVSCVFPGVSSQLDVPGKPLKGGVQEASESDARTTSADSFRREGVAARFQAPSWCPSSVPYL